MKDFQNNAAGVVQIENLMCDWCQSRFYKLSQLGQHKLSSHSDTWAVLDLLEAGMDEAEVERRYERCVSEQTKSMGRKTKSKVY